MKTLIPILIGLLVVGCGKKLTPEEEKIVGTWESFSTRVAVGNDNHRMVFRDDGIVEDYIDGKKRGEFKWKVVVTEGAWDREKSTAEAAVHKKVTGVHVEWPKHVNIYILKDDGTLWKSEYESWRKTTSPQGERGEGNGGEDKEAANSGQRGSGEEQKPNQTFDREAFDREWEAAKDEKARKQAPGTYQKMESQFGKALFTLRLLNSGKAEMERDTKYSPTGRIISGGGKIESGQWEIQNGYVKVALELSAPSSHSIMKIEPGGDLTVIGIIRAGELIDLPIDKQITLVWR